MVTDDAFILHKINYKNSSEIVKLLTQNQGRIDAIARGSRGPKSPFKGQLQAFVETTISFQGRRDLKTLTQAEQTGHAGAPAYLNQVAMLYCNELLLLLNMDDEHCGAVYPVYRQLIHDLGRSDSVALLLRYFELKLCTLNGYALSVDHGLSDSDYLVFQPDHGLVASHSKKNCDAGTFRRFISHQPLSTEQLRGLNRLFRPIVNHLVGGRDIHSRRLLLT